MRVLIVDDNPMDRAFLKKQLEKLGFDSIHEAENGTVGIYKYENLMKQGQKLDLMIVDWQMPQCDGYQMLQALRASLEESNIPVFMLTSFGDKDKVIKILKIGIEDFLVKPVSARVLTERVQKWVPSARGSKNVG